MSNCISSCCIKSKNKKYLYYKNIRVGGFGTAGYSGISTKAYECLGISKAHGKCAVCNNEDIFICENDNSDNEISIFVHLDKYELLSEILSCVSDCHDIQIIFIFKEDSRDNHKTYTTAQNIYKKHTLKFFACEKKLGGLKPILIK